MLGGNWRGLGRVVLDRSRGMVWKFFNRSPITLKFEAEKIERESQERERERAVARASCRFIFACKLLFYTSKLAFYTCNLLFYF